MFETENKQELNIGDRVYIGFLGVYGHIQRIEEEKDLSDILERPPETKSYWVKREDKETTAQKFLGSSLKKVERLSLEEIAQYLKPEQENIGSVYSGEKYHYELGNVGWGVGEIAGELIQNYWVLEWEQQEQDIRINSNIPFQLCNRPFERLKEINIDYYLKNLPFKGMEYGSFYRYKRTQSIYYTTEIAIATGKYDGKKIVTYETTDKNRIKVSFCRLLESFLEKFEKIK